MQLFSSKWFLCAAFVCLFPTNFAWAQFAFDFNINPNLIDSSNGTSTGTISDIQQQQLEDALAETAAFWQQFIVGFQPSVNDRLDGINIDVGLSNFADDGTPDGPNGILAGARPTGSLFRNGGFAFVVDNDTRLTRFGAPSRLSGEVIIDSADFDNLGGPRFGNVLNHEIAHSLGFGTLFEENDLAIDDTGQYTGAFGLETYQIEFDPDATFIPIELDGATSTRNGHLNETISFLFLEDQIPNPNGPGTITNPAGESDPGDNSPAPNVLIPGETFGRSLNAELLTGRIDPDAFLSDTTVSIFQDLGFEVVLPSEVRAASVPEPSSFIFLCGMTSLLALRRRKFKRDLQR